MKMKIAADLTSLLDVVLVVLFAFIFLRVEQEQKTVKITEDLTKTKEALTAKELEIKALGEQAEELKRRLKERKDLELEIVRTELDAFIESRIVVMTLEILASKDSEGRYEWKLHLSYGENKIEPIASNVLANANDDLKKALAKALSEAGVKPNALTYCFLFHNGGNGIVRARKKIESAVEELNQENVDGRELCFKAFKYQDK